MPGSERAASECQNGTLLLVGPLWREAVDWRNANASASLLLLPAALERGRHLPLLAPRQVGMRVLLPSPQDIHTQSCALTGSRQPLGYQLMRSIPLRSL